jgi:hypothetical protein
MMFVVALMLNLSMVLSVASWMSVVLLAIVGAVRIGLFSMLGRGIDCLSSGVGSYQYDPSVDMSGYVSIFDRVSQDEVESEPVSRQEVFSVPVIRSGAGDLWFSPKQRRAFHRGLSGLLKASAAHQRCSFLTLTSGVGFDVSRLPACFQVLRKRVEHRFGFLMQYLMVRTSEVNGVLHVLFAAPSYVPKRWISWAWSDITEGVSRIIRIFEVRLGSKSRCKSMARYMTQYVAGQVLFERFSYSRNWIFKGAVGVWHGLVSRFGLRSAIVRWERILSIPELISRFSVSVPFVQACLGG